MSERDTYLTGREARRDAMRRAQGPTRHEEASLRYLSGVQYVEERQHERARASGHGRNRWRHDRSGRRADGDCGP